MIKAQYKVNPNNDLLNLLRDQPQYRHQTQDDDIELSKALIARIDAERDYLHTCIYSRY